VRVSGRVHARAASLAQRYELALDANGERLRLDGERRFAIANPAYSSSTVHASLVDSANRLLAKFVLRLDYRLDLSRLLPL
jgi:hypothetical protein